MEPDTWTYTGWPFSLFKASYWHWLKCCILAKGPYSKTQLSNQCQREVLNKLNGHPVEIADQINGGRRIDRCRRCGGAAVTFVPIPTSHGKRKREKATEAAIHNSLSVWIISTHQRNVKDESLRKKQSNRRRLDHHRIGQLFFLFAWGILTHQ